MSSSHDKASLTGLARSIDALFPSDEPSAAEEAVVSPADAGAADGAEEGRLGAAPEQVGGADEGDGDATDDVGVLPERRRDPAATWFDADGPRAGRRREYRLVKSDLYMDVEFVASEDDEEEGAAAAQEDPGASGETATASAAALETSKEDASTAQLEEPVSEAAQTAPPEEPVSETPPTAPPEEPAAEHAPATSPELDELRALWDADEPSEPAESASEAVVEQASPELEKDTDVGATDERVDGPAETGDEVFSVPAADELEEQLDAAEKAADVGAIEERESVEEPPEASAATGGPAPAVADAAADDEEPEEAAVPVLPKPTRHAPRSTRASWVVAVVDDLEGAVEEYLAAGGARRDELGRKIRALAGKLTEARDAEPLADAAERLIVVGRHSEQEAPAALARMLITPDVATVLTARLGSARDDTRRSQLKEIVTVAPEELGPVVAEALATTDDRPARRTYIETLVHMGDDVHEVVAGMVEDPRWFVVRNAVLILGEIGGEDSVEHFTTTLAHPDGRVRRETLMALMKVGGEDAEMLVQSRLDDSDAEVRWAAVRAAGELGIERAVRPLLAQLDDESEEDVQVAILRALGQLGDPGAVPAVEKRAVKSLFSRTSTKVRVAAYRALGAIGTPHALDLLADAVDDRDSAVSAAAREALERARSD